MWATPGVSRAIFSTASVASTVRSSEAESGNWMFVDQVALVLDRDEPGGDAGKAKARQPEQADVDQEHDGAEAEAPAHGLAVGLRRPLEEPVKAAGRNDPVPSSPAGSRTSPAPRPRPRREGKGRG